MKMSSSSKKKLRILAHTICDRSRSHHFSVEDVIEECTELILDKWMVYFRFYILLIYSTKHFIPHGTCKLYSI